MQFEFKSEVNADQFDAIWGQMWGQCKSIRCNSRSIRGQPEVNGQFDAIWGQSEVNVAQFDAIRGQSEVNAGQSDAFRCQPEVKVDQKKKSRGQARRTDILPYVLISSFLDFKDL